MAEERTLPHSLDAERSVLGAILIDNEAWSVAASVLSESSFFRQAHQVIYRRVCDAMERDGAVDLVILRAELDKHGEVDEVGGPAYLAALIDGVPHSTNVEYYARIVREKKVLRDTIFTCSITLSTAYDGEDEPALIIQRAVSKLADCVPTDARGVVQAHAAIEQYTKGLDNNDRTPIMSGYADLDALLGGFKRSELVVIAARPSVGKTAFALGALDYMATHGSPGCFFSLEMGQDAIAARLLALRSHVPSARLERKEATTADYNRILQVMERPPVPLWIEAASRTVAEVGAWSRRMSHGALGLSVAAVDYIQLMTGERLDSRQAEVASSSSGLKQLAKELNVPVLALSQLSRAPEARRDKRPQLSDLRESGALEQDADVVIILFREEMHKKTDTNEGVAEAIVAKNRNGPTGVVRLAFLKELAMFANLAGAQP